MGAVFAHPVERELARLFDRHGIAWEYEPHTFVLEWDEDGTVREAFTPDFFLPDLGIYVECTVMRQALTRHKRRKARKTQERTGATVEIMFKRDVERLARRWDLRALSDASRSTDTRVSEAAPPGIGKSDMAQSVRALEVEPAGIHVERSEGASIVIVAGDVDLHSAPELRDRLMSLADAGTHHVVVDLSDATFLDSMALGVLLAVDRRLTDDGGSLDLVVSTPDIRRIFEITMLDRVFDLHETCADALAGHHNGRAS
jgi:anti-anti-sigma factor